MNSTSSHPAPFPSFLSLTTPCLLLLLLLLVLPSPSSAATVNKVAFNQMVDAHLVSLYEDFFKYSEQVKAMRGTPPEEPTMAALIQKLQTVSARLVHAQFGPPPHRVLLSLEFPASMPEVQERGREGHLVIEMAPLETMPHAVAVFLDMVRRWNGGAFHRNAGHVLQVAVQDAITPDPDHRLAPLNFPRPTLAFQEYNATYPHVKYTLGFAGRLGGPAFYINTIDNTKNHGPGSQGSATEADSCFGRVLTKKDEVMVEWMRQQPGGSGRNSFIEDKANHIKIVAAHVLKENERLPL